MINEPLCVCVWGGRMFVYERESMILSEVKSLSRVDSL